MEKKTNVKNNKKPYRKPYKPVQNCKKPFQFGHFAVPRVFYDFIRFCTILYGFLHL